jgi:hypothetical protein
MVKGKKTSEGEIVEMDTTTSFEEHQSGSFCPLWSEPGPPGLCDRPYYIAARINFSEPTVEPRPIEITMGDELYQVRPVTRWMSCPS